MLYFVQGRLAPKYIEKKSDKDHFKVNGRGFLDKKLVIQSLAQVVWIPEELLTQAISDKKADNIAELGRALFIQHIE